MTCGLRVIDETGTWRTIALNGSGQLVIDGAAIQNSPNAAPPTGQLPYYDETGTLRIIKFTCTAQPLDPIPITIEAGVASSGSAAGRPVE